MKSSFGAAYALLIILLLTTACGSRNEMAEVKILFLHHSTGRVIWIGNETSKLKDLSRRFTDRLAKGELPKLFDQYNKEHQTKYNISKMIFPKEEPYGWKNYPYDYYNIWVKNAGDAPYQEEPTLEMLTKEFQIIIFKHCFPVSNIQPDLDSADINSEVKTMANYQLQYAALKQKFHEFPDTKFILFTGAALAKGAVSADEATRANSFFTWVREEWDEPGDNIYLWDLYSLETEGGLYLKDEYSVSETNSHPNEEFAGKAVKLLFNRIIDVIENNGQSSTLTGKQ